MSVKQIADGVHHTNVGAGVYIIDRDQVTIIDTGVPGKSDQILDALRQVGRSPADVTNILITHYHQDHIGNLSALAKATEAQVFAPEKESSVIRDGGTPPKMRHRGILGAVIKPMVKLVQQPPHPVHHDVNGGDVLNIAGGIRVIDTPGHSVGHVVYLLANDGVIFVGDAAANLVRLDVMPANEVFPTAEKSFRALGELDFDVAGLAHGRQITKDASARFRKAARRYS